MKTIIPVLQSINSAEVYGHVFEVIYCDQPQKELSPDTYCTMANERSQHKSCTSQCFISMKYAEQVNADGYPVATREAEEAGWQQLQVSGNRNTICAYTKMYLNQEGEFYGMRTVSQ